MSSETPTGIAAYTAGLRRRRSGVAAGRFMSPIQPPAWQNLSDSESGNGKNTSRTESVNPERSACRPLFERCVMRGRATLGLTEFSDILRAVIG